MFDFMKRSVSILKNKTALAVAAVAVASGIASATPSMGTVAFPVDPASIVTSVSDAGASILVILFPMVIGFALIWALFRRGKKAI